MLVPPVLGLPPVVFVPLGLDVPPVARSPPVAAITPPVLELVRAVMPPEADVPPFAKAVPVFPVFALLHADRRPQISKDDRVWVFFMFANESVRIKA